MDAKKKRPTIEELLKRIEELEKRPVYPICTNPHFPCTLPHYPPYYPSPNTYPPHGPSITYYATC